MKLKSRDSVDVSNAYVALASRGAGYLLRDDGRVFLHTGPDALDLLHRLTTNDLLELQPGHARRTVMTNEMGRVIDVLWVAMLWGDEGVLLLTDAEDHMPLQHSILKYTIIEDACLHDLAETRRRITVVGDFSASALVKSNVGFEENMIEAEVGSVVRAGGTDEGPLAIRTDAIGLPTWDVVGDEETIERLVDSLDSSDIPEMRAGLFHAVRVSNRIPWPGRELNERVNPLEAGLIDLVDFDKGCYVGQEVIARLDSYDKVQRRLVSVIADPDTSNSIAIKEGVKLFHTEGGRDIGWITSAGIDVATGDSIGLAYLRKAYIEPNSQLKTADGGLLRISSA